MNYLLVGDGYPSEFTTTGQDTNLTGLLAALGAYSAIMLALTVLCLIATYKVFKKLGMEGWKGLIPVVNVYLLMEKVGVNHKWLLVVFFGGIIALVPILGALVYLIALLYFVILLAVSTARAFGKSTGFAIGLILLSPIFLCILGFGKSEFVGANPKHDIIFGDKEPSSDLATPIGSSKNDDNKTVETFTEEMPVVTDEPKVEEKVEEPVMTETSAVEEQPTVEAPVEEEKPNTDDAL